MRKRSTRDLSDKHETFLADTFGGRRTPGSGNQFNRPMDVRDAPDIPHAMAWDGKSTLSRSVGVTREMWQKAREQANTEIPALALRWYDNERLDVGLDLVVLDAHDFAAILEAARRYDRAGPCLDGGHITHGSNDCTQCGRSVGYDEGD
jgi:hypothetical protein